MNLGVDARMSECQGGRPRAEGYVEYEYRSVRNHTRYLEYSIDMCKLLVISHKIGIISVALLDERR